MFTEATLNLAVAAIPVNQISLHNGNPGVNGTANELAGSGYARQAATFSAPTAGERPLSADVPFSTAANAPVTFLGLWDGATFRGYRPAVGDQQANAAGVYTVKASLCKIALANVGA